MRDRLDALREGGDAAIAVTNADMVAGTKDLGRLEGLQPRARRHGRSMEEEALDILRNAVRQEDGPAIGLGSQIAGLFRGKGLDEDIEELRGHALTRVSFDR